MISSQQATARSFDVGESNNNKNEKGDSLTTTTNHNDVRFEPVFPKACTLLLNSGNIVTCDRLTRKSGRKTGGASDTNGTTNETTTVTTGPQNESEIEVTDMINNTIAGWLISPERESISIEEAKEVQIRHPGLYCKCESTTNRKRNSSVVTKDEVSTSVKLFLNSFDPECLRDSIKQIFSETGVDCIETLIISFPDKIFNQDHLPSELLLPLWKCVNEFVQSKVIHQAGLADFNFSYLDGFFKLIDETNESLKEVKQKDENNNNNTSEVAVDQDHQEICKPVINQVPLQTVCKMPEDLIQFAKANKMQLTSHSDSTEILNVNTLQQCIKKQMHEYDAHGWVHTWLARYTLVLKCRGIVNSKGYILNAHRDLKYIV